MLECEDADQIRLYLKEKFDVEVVLFTKDSNPEIDTEGKVMSVLINFDTNKDRFRHYTDSMYFFKRTAKKFGMDVHLILFGDIHIEQVMYVKGQCPKELVDIF